ncbi:MAG: hypothetical protein IKN53_01320, partial [Oscillibacter sp.]|nr:hypothetical protein [Oscillibacter sp.]
RAAEAMIGHVTSSTEVGEDGTLVSSSKPTLPQSMRMSMTADGNTYVYDPGMGNSQTNIGNIKNFGLPNALDMVYTNVNALFSMKKGEDKTVVFHIWMEGTDEACTDELKNSDFSIRLRFEGTDEAGNRLSGKTPRA